MKNIAELLVAHDIVRVNFTDPFTWTSGIKSPIYCDCRELIGIPEARDIIVNTFIEQLKENKISADIFAGTATAGIPWAAFVAERLNEPMLYVRSKPKGHGTGKMVEGRFENGKNIVVVEDALSTAGSSIKSVEALRAECEATVEHVLAIFSWDTPVSHVNAKAANVNLLPLTDFTEIVEALESVGKISAENRVSLERFHADPGGWSK